MPATHCIGPALASGGALCHILDMEIWPAIDIQNGRCVRLSQGDFARQSVYHDSVLEMAQNWIAQGATRLHLVDLDAAVGQGDNFSAIESVMRSLPSPIPALGTIQHRQRIQIQVGGGIRSAAVIQRLLDAGASRLVCGTRAIREPEWFAEMAERYPGRLMLGIDARAGRVAVEGWTQTTGLSVQDQVKQVAAWPLAGIVYTDIDRDGMLQGPDVDGLRQLVSGTAHPVIASGGVSSIQDIQALMSAGAAGCIIGKALYEGRLTLPEVLSLATAVAAEP